MMISSYQSDLESIFESIEQKIDHVNKVGDATETQAVIAKCQQDLKHADNIVRQLAVEVRTEGRSDYRAFLNRANSRLKNLQRTCQKLAASISRQQLFGVESGSNSVEMSNSLSRGYSKVRDLEDKMESSTKSLEESQRVIRETEEISVGITENLAMNRSLISGSHSRLQETGGFLHTASDIISGIRGNRNRQKILAGCMIGLLVIVIIALLVHAVA